MNIRWSPEAADDLAAIVAYIRKDNPAAAQRTARNIYGRAGLLKTNPWIGREGRVAGTRELPLPPLPFILIYRVTAETVEISNIIHGAQVWP
jgi:addiction module RelE/StbE family toxin